MKSLKAIQSSSSYRSCTGKAYIEVYNMGFIGVCHIENVGYIGVCHIENVGYIGVFHIEGVGFNRSVPWR
jgi:hypothetical protein